MNIAHINLAKGFRGGERQTAILIEELSKSNNIQTLFVRSKNSGLKDFIETLTIPNLTIIKIGKPYIFSVLKFRGFDIVHSHETKANQLSFFIKRILNIPYIITRRVQFTPSQNIFNLAIYKNAKSLVVLSSAIKNDLQKLDSNLKIKIIPDSFSDMQNLENEKLEFGDTKIIGHIGAVVDATKGQCTILETAKLLEKDNFHFVFIGDGQDLEKCKKISKNMKNVTFLGFKENPQRYISNFDIFVFPSLHEGLGSTLLDVMRFGIPIIASNVGGIPDIISDNGILINPQNSQELTEKILELDSDKKQQSIFREKSLEKINKYSPKMMSSKYQEIY